MVLKRNLSEGEGDGSKFRFQEPKRQQTSFSFNGGFARGFSSQELTARLEPILRVVVRDEVENALRKFCRSTSGFVANQPEPSGARTLQLHFQTNLPSTLFTSSRIESEDNIPVRLVLVDASTNRIVDSGPLSSIKVEIVALDGAFNTEDVEDWSENDFTSKIVHERAGKRPLVAGDLIVTLSGGVGELGDVCFTDNSSWIRCRKFRLGAKVVGTSAGARIKEAKSAAFVVKDHRGESYKKHHPPSLVDEIWRLERIAKDGAFHKRLAASGIFTLKDFLQLYITDPTLLRSKLGGGVSNRTWEIIIKHATACVLDDKLYTYHWDEENVGLVFNSIFKVVAATFDGQNYLPLEKLNAFQMSIVEDMKRQAYRNTDRFVPLDEASVFGNPFLLPSIQDTSASLGIPNASTSVLHQDHLQMVQASSNMTTSQPYAYEAEDISQLEVPMVQNTLMQVFSPALRNSFIMRDFCYGPSGDGWSAGPSLSSGAVLLTGGLCSADDKLLDEISFFKGNSNYYVTPTNQAVSIVTPDGGFLFSSSAKSPKARWCKIRAAIKWVSLRRDVAAKRTAQLLPYFDF